MSIVRHIDQLLQALECSSRLRRVVISTLGAVWLLFAAAALLKRWMISRHVLLVDPPPVMEISSAVCGLILLVGLVLAAEVCRQERLL